MSLERVPRRAAPVTVSDKFRYWLYVKARQIQIYTACSQLSLSIRCVYCTCSS